MLLELDAKRESVSCLALNTTSELAVAGRHGGRGGTGGVGWLGSVMEFPTYCRYLGSWKTGMGGGLGEGEECGMQELHLNPPEIPLPWDKPPRSAVRWSPVYSLPCNNNEPFLTWVSFGIYQQNQYLVSVVRGRGSLST